LENPTPDRENRNQSDNSLSGTGSPSVQSEFLWNTATGEYQLHRLRVKLLSRRLWLMYEQPEIEDNESVVGLQYQLQF
jgi:hypothetical protein